MNTTALGMGDGWEVNIARLIDKANETLNRSASSPHYAKYRRRQSTTSATFTPATVVDIGPQESPNKTSSMSSMHSGRSLLLSSSPHHRGSNHGSSFLSHSSSFRGDRGASYRLNDDTAAAWDVTKGFGGDARRPAPARGAARASTPLRATSPPPPPLSRFAEARVHEARIEGLEDKIKLEVQTMMRLDVDQRVSVAERASDALKQRIEELTTEVSGLGKTVRKYDGAAMSQDAVLEQIQADGRRNRSSIIEIEGWRADREGWCARTDATMESLAEDSRVLTRRCQTQHQAIGELGDRITQADLSAAVGATLKAAETATATALAPVRAHLLEELEEVRRRQSAAEKKAVELPPPMPPPVAVPLVSPAQVKSVAEGAAEEAASAAEERLWQRIEAHVRTKLSDAAQDAAHLSRNTREEVDRRLAEMEIQASGHEDALGRLRGDVTIAQGLADVPDTILALEKRLGGRLNRIDRECERRSREAHIGAQKATKAASDGLTTDLDKAIRAIRDRIKRLEEPERFELRSAAAAEVAATQPPELLPTPTQEKEQLEKVTKTVDTLVTGVAAAAARNTYFEGRIEELGEEVCGHALRLRCLEGLWREQVNNVREDTNTREAGTRGKPDDEDSDAGAGNTGAGAHDAKEDRVNAESQQDVVAAVERSTHQVPSLARPLRSMGLGGFLKRLGSTPSGSSSCEYRQGTAHCSTVEHKKKETDTIPTGTMSKGDAARSNTEGDGPGGEPSSPNTPSLLGQADVRTSQPRGHKDLLNSEPVSGLREATVREKAATVDELHSGGDVDRVGEGDGAEGTATKPQFLGEISSKSFNLSMSLSSDESSSASPTDDATAATSAAQSKSRHLAAKAEIAEATVAPTNLQGDTKPKTGCGGGGGDDGGGGDGSTNASHLESEAATEGETSTQSRQECNVPGDGKITDEGGSSVIVKMDEKEVRGEEQKKGKGNGVEGRPSADDPSESGSLLDESAHSRWSLSEGGGLDRLHAQHAVWEKFDRSVSSDSKAGEEGESAVSMSPTSRVGSYDMEHDRGEGRISPASQGGSTSASLPITPRSPGALAKDSVHSRTGSSTGLSTKPDGGPADQHTSPQAPTRATLPHKDSRELPGGPAESNRTRDSTTTSTDGEISIASKIETSAASYNSSQVDTEAATHRVKEGDTNSAAAGVFPELFFSDDDSNNDNDNENDNDNVSDDEELAGVVDFVAAERSRLATRHRDNEVTNRGGVDINDITGNNSGSDNDRREDKKIGEANGAEKSKSGRMDEGEGGVDTALNSDAKRGARRVGPGSRLRFITGDTSPGDEPWTPPDLGFSSEEEGDEIGLPLARGEPSSSVDMKISLSSHGSSLACKAERDDDGAVRPLRDRQYSFGCT